MLALRALQRVASVSVRATAARATAARAVARRVNYNALSTVAVVPHHRQHAIPLQGSRLFTTNTSKAQQPTEIHFTLQDKPGMLRKALKMFSDADVSLEHIESRPCSKLHGDYTFLVSTLADPSKVRQAVEALENIAVKVTVLDEDPNTSNAAWFPHRMKDLDLFAARVLGAGADLESDHPGFTDKKYRERRGHFAQLADSHRTNSRIPLVEYEQHEIETWGHVFRKLRHMFEKHACDEFLNVFPLLVANCGYREDNLPQVRDISEFLHSVTGFRMRPVSGLLSSRDFLAGLAFRVFHSTMYLRHHSKPLYTPEPDICHEIIGHVPLFADKNFAEFSQEIGLASLGASDEDILKLGTLYWFTVEFGLVRQHGELKAYGAGLLSSFGELEYAMSGEPELRPFDPEDACVQEYPITTYQPVYYVAESFDKMKQQMREFSNKMDKPFTARYNPYTERIELLTKAQEVVDLAKCIGSDLNTLTKALEKIAGTG
eukprot:m.143003 g.143003  ORF g.143003 m.143003 type:complete len:489 (-) comp17153_c3_seq2:95-1561(-)